MRLWHGSSWPRSRLELGADGGLHLGTFEQAAMRSSAFLHEVDFAPERVRRSRDPGGGWAKRIAAAKSSRHDGIVYLNRFEGVPVDELDAASRLADATDAAFRRGVPSAADSFICLDPEDVNIVRIMPWKGRITLYHGTSRENAAEIVEKGFDPSGWRTGPNSGRKGLLYLTSEIEDARWFADNTGDGAVISLSVRAKDLILDPDEALTGDVCSEILASEKDGMPFKLATRAPVESYLIKTVDTPSPSPSPW